VRQGPSKKIRNKTAVSHRTDPAGGREVTTGGTSVSLECRGHVHCTSRFGRRSTWNGSSEGVRDYEKVYRDK